MDSFEKNFSRKVKEAFDDYNANHLVDAGWQSFQKKLEGKRRAGFVVPLWAKAATIVMLLTLGGIFTYRLTQMVDKHSMVEAAKDESEPGTLKEVIEPAEEDPLPSDKALFVQEPQRGNAIGEQRVFQTSDRDVPDTMGTVPMATTEVHKSEHADTTLLAHINSHGESVQEASTDDDQDPIAVAIVEIEGDNERPLLPLDPRDVGHELPKRTRTVYGARLSGMYTIAENTISDGPGIALGLYTQHRITNRISIQPGLALAKHSYNVVDYSVTADYNAPSIDNFAGSTDFYEISMDIVAMEIPINVVLDIVKQPRKNVYFTLGTSTLVYLNQRYRRAYNNMYVSDASSNGSHETFSLSDKSEGQFKAFSHTDFFGLVNLSVGYSFLLGNKSVLSIEPYVQAPLKELTGLGVDMGFGGVSVNYRFSR